ncbi:unknown [Bacteroides sp. CAG:875]|nr:unknown [Bacteroides sp. CAG:875]
MENINYQFTQVPTKLMILLDVNCRSMLFTLCQLSSHYTKEDGRFFRTNADLALESRLSQKLVIATLDTLYTHGIVEIWSVGKGKGKHANYFKLNLERIKEFERLKMDELKNPDLQLPMVDYRAKGYSPSYLKKNTQNVSQEIPNDFPRNSQITNNINNIENIDNEDNINNEEIENSNINNIEDEYNKRINELLKGGMKVENILINLAKEDWECFKFFKGKLKQNEDFKPHYRRLLPLVNDLIQQYEPS